jgi:lipase
VELRVHEWGDRTAPAVVCLHGVSAHGRRFRRLAEERLTRRFRVLAPDLRGHGFSDWDPPWTIRTYAHDVLETLDGTGVARATFVGHSFGGRLILELAAREPGRVERAILLEPVLQLPGHVGADMAAWHEHAPNETQVDGAPHVYSREATIAVMRELTRELPQLARLPTLLVIAADSYLPSALWAEDLRAALAADVIRVPGGHDVLVDAFDATADAIEAFL